MRQNLFVVPKKSTMFGWKIVLLNVNIDNIGYLGHLSNNTSLLNASNFNSFSCSFGTFTATRVPLIVAFFFSDT